MKKVYQVILLFICVAQVSLGQNAFINRAGSGGIDEANDVLQLTPSKTISTGFYSEQLNFGGTVLQHEGADDGYIACQNANGQFSWALGINGPSSDKGLFLAKSPDGFIYLGGTFTQIVSIGTTSLMASVDDESNQDVFIAKINENGVVQWVKSFGGGDFDDLAGLTVTNQNKIWFSLRFLGNTTVGGTSYNSANLLNQNVQGFDAILVRLNDLGDHEFSRIISSPENERMSNLVNDDLGNIYTVVHSINTLSYGLSTISLSNQTNAVLLKINSQGNLIDRQRILAPFIDAKALDVMGNNLSIGGDFNGSITFPDTVAATPITNSYSNKIFTVTFQTQNLNIVSYNHEGSGSLLSLEDVAYNAAGNLWVTGRFRCQFQSLIGTNETGLFNNVGFNDAFICLYQANANNQRLYKQYIGSEKDDGINAIYCKGLTNPIFAGYFQEQLLFNKPANCTTCGLEINEPTLSFCGNPNYNNLSYIEALGNRDIMVGNIFNTTLPILDLYDRTGTSGCTRNILQPIIFPNQDSLFSCDSVILSKDLNLIDFYADSIVNWNYQFNGVTFYDTVAYQPGLYTVVIQTNDGCRTMRDSIQLNFETSNMLPEISVEGATIYKTTWFTCAYVYTKLQGDSATITGTSLPNDILTWEYQLNEVSPIQSIASGVNTIDILQPGHYIFTRTTASGCSYSECILIRDFIIGSGGLGVSYDPNFRIFATGNLNDTIFTCPLSRIELEFTDSLDFYDESIDFILGNYGYWDVRSIDVENPQSIVNNAVFPMIDPSTDEFYPRYSIINHKNYFETETEGWYIATICILSNPTTLDTVLKFQRRFYVKFRPKLQFIVNFNPSTPLICPGDTLDVSFSTAPFFVPYTAFVNGVQMPGGTNSYPFFEPGTIAIVPSMPTVVTGLCPADLGEEIDVKFKTSPSVTMNPENGLKCPNATVTLSAEPGSSYEWFGPGVPEDYNEDTLLALFPGYYQYQFNDLGGCPLLSSKALVRNISATLPDSIPDTVRCGNLQLYIALDNDTSLHWNWLPPLSGTNYYQFINSAGSYAVTGRVCETIDTFYFDVAQGIYPAIIQFEGKDTLCQGDTLTLSINSDAPYINWSTGSSALSIQVSTQSNYFVTVSDDLGCEFTDFQNVPLYYNPPVPQFIHQPACPGVPLTVFTNSNVPVHWSVEEFTPLLNVGTSYTLNVTQNNQPIGGYARNSVTGCRSAWAGTSLLLDSLTFYPTIPNEIIFCAGDSILVIPENAVGISTGIWTGPNSFQSNTLALQIDGIPGSLAGPFTFEAIMDSGFCVVEPPVVMDLTQRFLDQTFFTAPDSICAGIPLSITSTPVSDYVYQWTGPPQIIQNGYNFNLNQPIPENTGFYYLTARDSNCIRIDSVFIFVSPVPPPVPTLSYPDQICQGDTLFLYNADSLNTTSAIITWFGNDAFVQTGTNEGYIPNFNENLNHGIAIQFGINMCLSEVTIPQLEIIPSPIFYFALNQPFCENDPYLVSGPDGNYTYLWHTGDTTQSIFITQSDTVRLTVTDINGCSYHNNTFIQSYNCDLDSTPNTFSPNGDGTNDLLEFTVEGATFYGAIIFNRWGKVIKEIGPTHSTWDGTDLQGDPVPDGTYFYTLNVGMINGKLETLQGFVTLFK